MIGLSFVWPADPLSMNDGNHAGTWRQTAAWRDRAYFAWVEAHPGVGPSGRTAPTPGIVSTVLVFPNRRRRDPINFARTVKAIVDGLVMAGAWPDDELVEQQIPVLRVGPVGECHVTVR